MLIFIMIFNIIPSGTIEVLAADNRTEITEIEATSSNFDDSIGLGKLATAKPTFVVTKGSPVTIPSGGTGIWQKKNGDNWENAKGAETFSVGTWRFKVHICIDDQVDKYKLGNPITVKVNGIDWQPTNKPLNGFISCYDIIYSPEYIIEEPSELIFHDSDDLDIKTCYKNKSINVIELSQYVEGGVKPYKFQKISGPNWISVNEGGQVLGTPVNVGENEDLVVRVKDNLNNYKEITISVAKTVTDPIDREGISNIEVTSYNIDNIPKLVLE